MRNYALVYRVHITVSAHQAKVLGRTKNARQVGTRNVVFIVLIRIAHRMRPVIMDYVFRNVKIVKIVGSMNFAVVISEVQACVLPLVLELDVIMIKIAHQVNIVLERITKCVPERTLRKRVTQMEIAPLDNVVTTTGNVLLGHATQKRKVKVKVKI